MATVRRITSTTRDQLMLTTDAGGVLAIVKSGRQPVITWTPAPDYSTSTIPIGPVVVEWLEAALKMVKGEK